ncbi:hypothetical protein DSO57_1027351 [Entomophthora muscae]|uniref:Uncharacterized protein n=1 Tax=Entomophthora muscae TaxID=34485 RepID=A0ACC2TD00_9FUNG|nr:hypothetical protein DSO57_1027351 [Entomophthora muscae]
MRLLDILVLISAVARATPIVVGYFMPNDRTSIKDIPFDKLTHINVAFGTLSSDAKPSQVTLNDGLVKEVVEAAQKSSTKPKVLLSLGGWGGSKMFSKMVQAKHHRKEFITKLVGLMKPIEEGGLGLDGIDLDWEFPGEVGAGNFFNASDTDNLLLLLSEMRAKFTSAKLITAAVPMLPFKGKDNQPIKDASRFAKYFDYVTVMAYNIYGSWSTTTGPNAPLHTSKDVSHSLADSLNKWKEAKFPPHKIVGGLAFYGQTFETAERVTAKSQFVKKKPPQPHKKISHSVSQSDVYLYKFIRETILSDPQTPKPGYVRYFDKVTQTPYLYKPSTHQLITYDDTISIQAKASYIQNNGFGGAMIWELTNDYNNELIDATIRGLKAHTKYPASTHSLSTPKGSRRKPQHKKLKCHQKYKILK